MAPRREIPKRASIVLMIAARAGRKPGRRSRIHGTWARFGSIQRIPIACISWGCRCRSRPMAVALSGIPPVRRTPIITRCGSIRRIPIISSSAATAASTSVTIVVAPSTSFPTSPSRSTTRSRRTCGSRFTTSTAACRTTAAGAGRVRREIVRASPTLTGFARPAAMVFTRKSIPWIRTPFTASRRAAT